MQVLETEFSNLFTYYGGLIANEKARSAELMGHLSGIMAKMDAIMEAGFQANNDGQTYMTTQQGFKLKQILDWVENKLNDVEEDHDRKDKTNDKKSLG